MAIITYHDFTGGFNDTVPPDALHDNEMRRCINADVFFRGGFKQRKGVTKLNETSYDDEIDQLIELPLSTSNSRIYAMINKKLYEIHNDGTRTEKITLHSNKIGYVAHRDRLYFVDGNKYYVLGYFHFLYTEGTFDVKENDIIYNYPASSGGGEEKAYYKAKSNLGRINTMTEDYSVIGKWEKLTTYTTEDGDQTIEKGYVVKNTPASSGGGITHNFYRAKEDLGIVSLDKENYNNNVVWENISRRVFQVYDSTVNIKKDDIVKKDKVFYKAKSNLGDIANLYVEDFTNVTRWEDVTDIDIPDDIREVEPFVDIENNLEPIKRCKYIVWHPSSTRFFAVGDSENPTAVYFSEMGDPSFFKELNILYPSTSDGYITGIANIGSSVIVSYKNGWRVYTGIDVSIDATWRKIPVPEGAVNQETITLTPHSLTFLGRNGLYMLDMSIINTDTNMVTDGTSLFRNLSRNRIEKTIEGITDKTKCTAIYHDMKYYLAYQTIEEEQVKNRVLVYDIQTNAFVLYDNWKVNDFLSTIDNRLLFASKNYIIKCFDGFNDVDVETGEAIPVKMDVHLKPYSLGGKGQEFNKKFVNKVFLMAQQLVVENEDVNVKIVSDYDYQDYDTSFNESLVWGRLWGLVWGWTDIVARETYVKRAGLRHQLIFTSSKIDNVVFIYNIGFDFDIMLAEVNRIPEHQLINDNLYT